MRSPLIAKLTQLAEPPGRTAATVALAEALGVESLLFFVRDPELNVLLPPVGFPQTVAGGPRWRAFLKACAVPGRHEAMVDCPLPGEQRALALVEKSVALVSFGPRPDEAALAEIAAALPLLGAIFAAEHAARLAQGEASVARTTGRRAHDLALALDAARGEVERALEDSARLNAALKADDRRKDEFLAMLSHELRNPMAAIGAAVEVMSSGTVEAHGRALEIIRRQGTQLTRLVDDLLDVARVTRGKIALRLTVVDVASVLRRATESMHALATAHRGPVEVITPDPVYANVDPARLEQMITNLLTNAFKYTDAGGRIRASAIRDGEHVVVRVEDSGIGISSEMLGSIFDPFVQVTPSIDRGAGGLGIGLTLVRQLAELHGGTIEAESEEGVGSVFSLRLPRADPPAALVSPPAESARTAHKQCVLVVDDNQDAAEMLVSLLESWGHEAVAVLDGPSAVSTATELRPDVVLLDIGLPGMDGYEVAARLRAGERTRRSRILVVSGYGQDGDRQRAREAGCDGHLVKPVDLAVLRRSVESADPG